MNDTGWRRNKYGGLFNINNYMNDKIRNNNSEMETIEKLSELEYEVLCEEFAETLTDEEKQIIESYGVGGGASYHLNNPDWGEFERTYRFEDKTNSESFIEKKLSFRKAIDTEIDEKFYKMKSGDQQTDENHKFNYDVLTESQKSIREMDNIFEKKGISLDKDIVVYRKGHETLEDLKNGVTRYGYTSTSAKSRINKKTPGGLMLGDVEFEIIVPKGMKFLPIKHIVSDDIKNQNEILLPRNLKLTLLKDESEQYVARDYSMKKKNKYVVKAE